MNAYLAVNHKPSRCRVKPLACSEELKTLHESCPTIYDLDPCRRTVSVNPRRRVYLWVLFYQKNCRKTRTINHDPTCMHPTVNDGKRR